MPVIMGFPVPITYDSFISEVNCQTMESRSKSLWSFTAFDQAYVGSNKKGERVGDLWVNAEWHGRWTKWEPIEEISSAQQWICDNR